MSKRHAPLIDDDGEVRELTAADLVEFRPAREVIPAEHHAALGIRRRGPQKAPLKVLTSIRLSPDVLAFFKASGSGWQSRLDDALKAFVAEQEH